MTHPMQTTALDEIGQLLAEQGFDGLADAMHHRGPDDGGTFVSSDGLI